MELTVITGLSGAGKSEAMGVFEDAGYFCVDNLPPRLLPALSDLFALEGSKVERAAVVCDVRGGIWFDELSREVARLGQVEGVRPKVVFLEARDDVLLARFRETRRRHPLAEGGAVLQGIEREREALSEVRDRADLVIDTSDLNVWQLRDAVNEALVPGARPRMRVTFTSFGYKYGVPVEVDLMFDVRFLRNPHYVPELAPLTGLDEGVVAYLDRAPGFDEFIARLEGLLDFLLPAYEGEGKRHLVIAFGCTGGRHRSVALAERMAARYTGAHEVSVSHRDITRAGARPAPAAEGAPR
ncbi:MAG: RNase adapter RapZ [Thermoleophilia bacterium]|nr:RNase adapter RapZ [Thermoleophilia bacterium]